MGSTAGMAYEEMPAKSSKGLAKTVAGKAYRHAVENHSDIHTLLIISYKRRVGILATAVVLMGVHLLVPSFYSMLFDALKSLV